MLQGVYIAYRKDKTPYYRASIHYNGKHVSIGSFDTEEEAHNAYKEASSLYKSNAVTIDNYASKDFILADDKVVTILTDGAAQLCGMGITDYTICGMGGELIARIIEDAPHLCDPAIRLILQPMTRQATLRRSLARLGFSIRSEKYSFADGKYYVCILAEFTGQISETDPISAELGTEPSDGGRVEYIGYLKAKLSAAERALRGKTAGGDDATYEAQLVSAIAERINKLKECSNL